MAFSDSTINISNGIAGNTSDTLGTPLLFQNHLLAIKNDSQQIHYTEYDFFITGVLLISFTLFVWLYVSHRKRLNQIISGFYINRFANQLTREEFNLSNRVSVFLSVLFVLTLTLFISEINQYFSLKMLSSNILVSYLTIATFILLIYGVKVFGIRLLGNLFQTTKEGADNILLVFLFGNTLGLFLLPIVISIAFIKQISPFVFIYIGISIIIIFILIRIVRGIIIGLNSPRFSNFYLFLYLCTLEILPFVILAKLFLLKMK